MLCQRIHKCTHVRRQNHGGFLPLKHDNTGKTNFIVSGFCARASPTLSASHAPTCSPCGVVGPVVPSVGRERTRQFDHSFRSAL